VGGTGDCGPGYCPTTRKKKDRFAEMGRRKKGPTVDSRALGRVLFDKERSEKKKKKIKATSSERLFPDQKGFLLVGREKKTPERENREKMNPSKKGSIVRNNRLVEEEKEKVGEVAGRTRLSRLQRGRGRKEGPASCFTRFKKKKKRGEHAYRGGEEKKDKKSPARSTPQKQKHPRSSSGPKESTLSA